MGTALGDGYPWRSNRRQTQGQDSNLACKPFINHEAVHRQIPVFDYSHALQRDIGASNMVLWLVYTE